MIFFESSLLFGTIFPLKVLIMKYGECSLNNFRKSVLLFIISHPAKQEGTHFSMAPAHSSIVFRSAHCLYDP